MKWLNFSLLEFYTADWNELDISFIRINFRSLFGIYYYNIENNGMRIKEFELHFLFMKYEL